MRIAVVTHRVVEGDGQGRVNFELSRAAVRSGHDVSLVATEVDDELVRRDRVEWIPVPVGPWPTKLLQNLAFAVRSSAELYVRRDRFDLVLANGAITWMPADINVAHFVHSAWAESPAHTAKIQSGPYAWYQQLFTAWNALWEKIAFRQAERVVAVSGQVRDDLVDIGVPPERIQVIYNGVDLDEFHPGVEDRSDLDLPRNPPLGIFVGDIKTPRKNLDTVLRALVRVPDVHLAVAGTTDGSPYPAMADRLGISERVHFLGFRRDVARIMRAGDLCLCPSRYEPFSLVALEALASGLPVITARTVGAADLITPDIGSVVNDPENAAAIAEAMKHWTADRGSNAHGEMARAVAQRHSFIAMANRYVDCFEALNGQE